MRTFRITLLMLVILVSAPFVHGQEAKKPLTNTDVVKLVQASLPESTIVLAIQQSETNFDTSPSALIELKKQGIPQTVTEAMIRASSVADAAKPATDAPLPTSVPALPKDGDGTDVLADGTYYKSPGGWVKLEQLTMAGGGATHMGKMFVPGLTPQMVWTYRGPEAPVQIADRRPTFVVKQSPYIVNIPGHSDRDLLIVRFNKKKDHRELQTTSGGNMFTFKAGLSKEKTPEIAVAKISDTTFSITPTNDLDPGEYLLTFSALGFNGFDFGIRSGK
jgi:hypothetical protein